MANRTVTLIRICKTEKGWRRYPVAFGKNGRIRPGWVMVGDEPEYYEQGRYELRMFEGSKLVYAPAGETPAEAVAARDRMERKLKAKETAQAAGILLPEDAPGRISLAAKAREFIRDAEQRGAKVAADVNRLVTGEFLRGLKKAYVDEITREDVFEFHAALRKRKCSDRTVANKHARVASFLRFAGVDKEILPPAPRYDETLPTMYTREQIADILAVADPFMRLVIGLALKCGLREQEIVHLEWPDIHEHDKVLRVSSKPRYDFRVKDSEERDIPIADDLLAELKSWQRLNPKLGLLLGTNRGYASEWIEKIAGILKLIPGEDVFVIPGNHDIQRDAVRKSATIQGYHATLRETGKDPNVALVEYLQKDDEAKRIIFKSLQNYNDFAAKYQCNISADEPYWEHAYTLSDHSTLNLRGMNSTLISDEHDSDTAHKLVVGDYQLELLRQDGVEHMILCHHPPQWMVDQDQAESLLTSRTRIQLFGHKHMQRVTRIEDSVRIVAGAVHPEKREPNWKPKYNFIEIDVEPRGADTRFLIVRVYPRVALSDDEADLKKQLREADAALDAKAYARYPKLTATEVKTLVVDDKWLATLDAAIHGEMDRVSQQLTQRVKELAERYETPLPQMTSRVAQLEAKVNQHLERMGFSWV